MMKLTCNQPPWSTLPRCFPAHRASVEHEEEPCSGPAAVHTASVVNISVVDEHVPLLLLHLRESQAEVLRLVPKVPEQRRRPPVVSRSGVGHNVADLGDSQGNIWTSTHGSVQQAPNEGPILRAWHPLHHV
jgi:hypothetical protein